jgi:hypothetical protein
LTFELTLEGWVPEGAVLRIDLPDQIGVYKKTYVERRCGYETNYGFTKTNNLRCRVKTDDDDRERYILIENGFPSLSEDDP